jgi:hypothetical protein
VHVRVDEPWRDQLAHRIDGLVHAAFEAFADVQDFVALEDDLSVAHQRVLASFVGNDPSRCDLRAHVRSSPPRTASPSP